MGKKSPSPGCPLKGSPPGPMMGLIMPGGPLPPPYRGPMGGNPGPGPISGGPDVPGEWLGGEGRRGEF